MPKPAPSQTPPHKYFSSVIRGTYLPTIAKRRQRFVCSTYPAYTKINFSTKVSRLLWGIPLAVVVGPVLFGPAISSAAGPTIRPGTTTTYGVLAGSAITNTGPTTISGTAGGDVGLSPGTSYTGSGSVTASGTNHITDSATSTAITSVGSTMTLANGAQACNVYWRVGSSATIGVNSTFIGHVYALTSITANTGASIDGQLLARNGAVTLVFLAVVLVVLGTVKIMMDRRR